MSANRQTNANNKIALVYNFTVKTLIHLQTIQQ